MLERFHAPRTLFPPPWPGKIDNYIRGLEKVPGPEVGDLSKLLRISMVDEDGLACGRVSAIDIAPAISNHKTSAQINIQGQGGALQHSRVRLAIFGRIVAIVANFHPVDWKQLTNLAMEFFDCLLCQRPFSDVRLIGDNKKTKVMCLEQFTGLRGVRDKLQLVQARWGE